LLFLLYAVRNLRARARANFVTLLSIALFVAGSTLGLTFYLGLRAMTHTAAPPENIIVMSKGAIAENESTLERDTINALLVRDEVRKDGATALAAREMVFDIYVEQAATGNFPPRVLVRGIDENSLKVHQITITQGTVPAPNSLELLVGRQRAEQYPQLAIGSTLHLPAGESKVVGVFTAHGGPLEAEIFTPRAAAELHTKSKDINSVSMVIDDASRVPDFVSQIDTNKALNAHAASYADWWSGKVALHTIALVVLVLLLLLSGVAAVAIAATMSAAVAVRIPELAALAAIGIRKSVLGRMVLAESLLLGTTGGLVGFLAGETVGRLVHKVPFSGDPVAITPSIGIGMVGACMGILVAFVGGILPSLRVRRLDILRAMR
jgi:ABC-type lipoprotein release transport system permease subunit